jgi:hypothetical protein
MEREWRVFRRRWQQYREFWQMLDEEVASGTDRHGVAG